MKLEVGGIVLKVNTTEVEEMESLEKDWPKKVMVSFIFVFRYKAPAVAL
jgi:hypothetical protein